MPGEGDALSVQVVVRPSEGEPPVLDASFATGATTTAIMGRSGAGKTTLLAAIAGLVRPSAGRIVIGGEVVYDAEARIWVPPHRRRVALVFQSLALFPHLRVWENVAYGLPPDGGGRTRARARERASAWLERARAGKLADRAPATLSGGEAQRVALARALASEPRLLLLDEPFSALDEALRVELGDVLRDLLAAQATPVLLVTHDRRDAARLASRVLRLEAGQLVAAAPAPAAEANAATATPADPR